jgi:hypothetical protein
MTPLEVKTGGKKHAKKRIPDSGKVCVLKRKVKKCDFSLQYIGLP